MATLSICNATNISGPEWEEDNEAGDGGE
jgi:hypothetical protein